MNLKRFTLLCALAAAQLHAATPEAAMNAARAPEADVVFNISAAKIYASEFSKPALAFVEKFKALIAREDKKTVQKFDLFLGTFKTANISLADVRAISFSGDTDDNEMPVFAIHFEKPLTLEHFRKCATAMIEWMEDGFEEELTIEPLEKSVAWTDFFDDRSLVSLLGDDNNIVYVGSESEVNAAMKRLEAGTRVEYPPAMKALLDETLTRRDAYVAMSSGELNDMLQSIIFWQMGFDEDTPVGKKMEDAIEALGGFTVGVDSTDKLTATATLVFNAPEHAAFVNEFLSAAGLGMIKSGLFMATGAGMPFMDSLKVSTQGKTVTVTGEVVAKDLEIILAGLEKMFPPPPPERPLGWD